MKDLNYRKESDRIACERYASTNAKRLVAVKGVLRAHQWIPAGAVDALAKKLMEVM